MAEVDVENLTATAIRSAPISLQTPALRMQNLEPTKNPMDQTCFDTGLNCDICSGRIRSATETLSSYDPGSSTREARKYERVAEAPAGSRVASSCSPDQIPSATRENDSRVLEPKKNSIGAGATLSVAPSTMFGTSGKISGGEGLLVSSDQLQDAVTTSASPRLGTFNWELQPRMVLVNSSFRREHSEDTDHLCKPVKEAKQRRTSTTHPVVERVFTRRR